MATLLDRLARLSSLPGEERVPGHAVENALKLYFHGKVTRAQMLAFFNIPPAMEADFDLFKARYDTFGVLTLLGVDARHSYVEDLEACIVALQQGLITKAQFNTFTGLSLDAT